MDRLMYSSKSVSQSWLWKMAWRDSRRSRSKLFLFICSIILGISALVAINAFRNSLYDEINTQAKTLLGADLVLESNKPVGEDVDNYLDSLSKEKSRESAFASMIYFPRTDGSRLAQVRALEGNFPYYGEIGTVPETAARQFQASKFALVDQTLMLQYDVEIGDVIRVGTEEFEITGKLNKVPGQSGIAASVAPVVYIPYRYLEATGLVQRGSRVNYNFYFKFKSEEVATNLVESEKEKWKALGLRHETIEERKKSTGETFSNLTNFLNLVAFVALLLGCVGVASAVHIYVKEKVKIVSLLRCLGVNGWHAFQIYLYQILAMGVLGSIIGALIGSILQGYLPALLKDFIPLSIAVKFSWKSLLEGVLLGSTISLLFALIPLLAIRNVSPLTAIRAATIEKSFSRDRLVWLAAMALVVFVFGFAWMQIKDWKVALYFTLGIVLAFGVLTGLAKGITILVRKFAPTQWNYVWRQGLANLYRPQNQTLILIVTIGLGTALITTLYFIQDVLVDKVSISASGERPNMVLFDIQSEQKDEIRALTVDYEMPVIQEVPVITMRLMEINGITLAQARADSTLKIPDYAFNREYRVTYRENIIDSEVLEEGVWQSKVENPNDSILVSISKGYAENLNLKIGDELLFNVQGALIKTYIGSFRDVDWNRVQTNFLVVFPTGVLENAPQFHVLITRTENPELAARYQQAIVRSYPNISIVNLELILQTLDDILSKVAFVIRFMAGFSIITGLLVLAGSVIISRFQRIQESVLLRTLGAVKAQVYKITAMEYLILGSLASMVGIVLAMAGSWALAYFVFETSFIPSLNPIILMFGAITSLTVAIGMANSKGVVDRPPLEILRNE